jgi:hypothetical protein
MARAAIAILPSGPDAETFPHARSAPLGGRPDFR